MYRQMRYPPDFQFDYEDEDGAEEEMYRTELRKLNQKLIRVAPETCLQFTCQTLSQLQLPLSSAPTPDVEAALRLVYHYCEGIRPPPGMKVVMRNETFRNLLVALHTSDITFHLHREVLTLYYETAVRYHPLLKERPELLQKVLESLTGTRGLQHEHPRVRSRCCYLLLRLVKSVFVGSSNSSNTNNATNNINNNVLRPYVETAVSGIQNLLENNAVVQPQLRLEATLNLFETIGLLLGKTGLEPAEQQQYLTQVMTPHVRSIERVLDQQKQAVAQEPEVYGDILSGSIAAIAFLSKGFKKQPPYEIQMVLLETLNIALAVLEALPNNEQVRNKSFVLLQRLIQCLEDKVLPSMPRLLYLLIAHCTTEDVLDVAQLFNQLCIKFKANAIPAMDAALLPFLQKCHALIVPLSIWDVPRHWWKAFARHPIVRIWNAL
jgi:exportin-T